MCQEVFLALGKIKYFTFISFFLNVFRRQLQLITPVRHSVLFLLEIVTYSQSILSVCECILERY